MNDRLTGLVSALFDFIDNRQVFRRVAFVWVLYLTDLTVNWTIHFASNSPRSGMEVAAIIAAVWTPMMALQGAIFKFYDNVQEKITQRRNYRRRSDDNIPRQTKVVEHMVSSETTSVP